ncbi:MAG: 50S ribosomal protein L3 N(5)-glutamine methyltransferase [Thiohalomonadaceae bacterium]
MPNIDEAVQDLTTIRDFVRWGMSLFKAAGLHHGHGMPDAQDEAVYLVLHALHLPPDLHASHFDARLTRSERRQVAELLARRVRERLPAPYLTGEAWFAGLPFFVDQRVLVPRSPIAELIENRFEPWVDSERVERILDLCTGSGCIAVACAMAFPGVAVDGSDISSDALAVAAVNVERHQADDQVRLVQSDLFSELQGERYDVIVSNPPYVDAADMAALPPEFRHEPAGALAAGEDGLDLVRVILREAADHLTPEGILVVEVGNSAAALEEAYPEVPFTWLEFERGEAEVFLLTAEQLHQYRDVFAAAA